MDLNSFVSGSLGGLTGIMVSYPFDTIKVRIQNQHFEPGKYKGTIDTLFKTIKTESALSLYRGMSSPLVGSMFINAVLFGVESNIRNNLDFEHTSDDPERFKYFALSGALAGAVQGVLITPIELVKIKMQLVDSHYKSTLDCLKGTRRKYGYYKGFTRGLSLSVLREIPGSAIYFFSFEVILDSFTEKGHIKHKLWHLLLSGGLAGCLSWGFTYPIDVLKTKFQADRSFKSIRQCFEHTLKNEGYMGFWRGLNCALLRAFPCNSACFATVAMCERAFPIDDIDDE